MKKVVIVGGGISGLCSAYYLVKEGFQVTVIDKNDITSGASFVNAGYIVPSHIISLAAPGMISKGLKWMFDSSGPFYIKPRMDLEFFRWALNFRKAATLDNVERSIPVLKEINLQSRDLYEELISSLDFKFHYSQEGLLMAYKTAKAEEEELKVAERVLNAGLDVRQLSKEELKKLQPGFSDEVKGAVHYTCDRHMTPNHFMHSLKSWLNEKGVKFELNQEVRKVVTHKNDIIAVETRERIFEADEFVLAAGSWTSALAKSLKLNIPIQGGKGYSMDVHRPTGITVPAILVEAKVAVTPMDGFVRFAGTMEFSGNNSLIRTNRVEAIAESVKKFFSDFELTGEETKSAVSGLRPVSPDGLPFIGKSSKFGNLTIAAGHAMMGWSLGPATGKLVTQLIKDEQPMLDLAPFRPERFQ